MNKALVFLLLIFLLPSVSAEYAAFGDTALNAVPCETITTNFTIQNLGAETATYALSVDGDASDFVTFSSLNFGLESGQTGIINAFYTIPCSASPGTYESLVYFSDDTEEKELAQTLTIATPDNIKTIIAQNSMVIPPCETGAFTIVLENPLNFTEVYLLSAYGHENIHLSEKRAVLTALEKKNILLSITPEDCTQSGTFPLTVHIETEKSRQEKDLSFELIITSTDIADIGSGISTIRTDYGDNTADVTIENLGDRITTYTLSTTGAPWAHMTPDTVTLNPGQSKTVGIRFTPTSEILHGTYPITLTATVDETGIRYSKDIAVKLGPPSLFERNPTAFIALCVVALAILIFTFYSIRYLRSERFAKRYAAWKEKRAKRRAFFAQKRAEQRKKREQARLERIKQIKEARDARIKAREDARKAYLERIERARQEKINRKLETERALLEKRETAKQALKKEVEQEYKKQYHFVSRKEILTGGKIETSSQSIAPIIIGIVLILLAFFAVIALSDYLVELGIGLLIVAVIILAKRLARRKLISAHWKLAPEKTPLLLRIWKRGLQRLSIVPQHPIKDFKLLVKKARPSIMPNGKILQLFTLKTNVAFDAITITALFNVAPNTTLAYLSGVRYASIPLQKTRDGMQAQLSKAGTYALYTPTDLPQKKIATKQNIEKKTTQPSRRTLLYRSIMALVGLAVIIAAAIIVVPPSPLTGIPPQEWKQDTVHRINLAHYFSDPDNETLTYTVSGNQHITIDVSGDAAYLTPETGWIGEERVKFTATDQHGSTIGSNTVPLRVSAHLLSRNVQQYAPIVLAIIAIILLVFAARLQQKN